MTDENNSVPSMFGSVKFIGSLFAKNVYLGAIVLGVLMVLWIWYSVMRKKIAWKAALKEASESIASIGAEGAILDENTTNGDDFNPTP